jgi:hypothetical protein
MRGAHKETDLTAKHAKGAETSLPKHSERGENLLENFLIIPTTEHCPRVHAAISRGRRTSRNSWSLRERYCARYVTVTIQSAKLGSRSRIAAMMRWRSAPSTSACWPGQMRKRVRRNAQPSSPVC